MSVTDDYDSPWKAVIEQFFPEFMGFYFPVAHDQIDWSLPYEFLDQELREVVRDAELGKRFVDKLVKVVGLNGVEGHLYIHIEVQGQVQAEFAERMFVYNYRLYDRYRQPIASMAVLTDDQPDWRPDHFGFEVLGCRCSLNFPMVKLSDYEVDLEELMVHPNPFALVTAAHLLTQRTKGKPEERFEAKRQLVRLLYHRSWDKQRIIDLFSVLDWMMRLPKFLTQALRQEIDRMEKGESMRYVTSIEELGIEKGLQQGLQQGRQEGVQQGRQEGEATLLRLMLAQRFGELSDEVGAQLQVASEEQLRFWASRLFSATTVDDIFRPASH